ncbi:hypothetical protein CKO41_08675 [Thiococcus pfennigii]|nr:hypothetical protein [Thiococcus pfennigii]
MLVSVVSASFLIVSPLVLAFVVGTRVFPGEATPVVDGAKGWPIDHIDGLSLVAGNASVVFWGHRCLRRLP